MRRRSLLVVSAVTLPIAAAGLSLHNGGSLPHCSWSPLTELQKTLFCETDNIEVLQAGPSRQKVIGHLRDEWTGPHGCVQQYCLYANQGFSGGRGIVVITTEANLPLIQRLPSASPDENKPTSSPAFNVDKIPGKGLGLVANSALQRGDAVMKQTPAFLAQRHFLEATPQPEQYRLLERAVDMLPPATRAKFLAQHGHFGGHHISDVLATNSFQIDLGKGAEGQHFGNYPEVSRYNHDCRPNVAFYIDANLTHHSTVARPVRAGEELTISYLNPLEAHDARQQRTKIAWGFACGCSQCSQPRDLTNESDERLGRIRELESRLEDITARNVDKSTIKALMKLYEGERLHTKMAGPLTLAALNSNLLGLAKEAKQYAKAAVEAGLIEGGETGDVQAMRDLGRDPKRHFTWKKRVV